MRITPESTLSDVLNNPVGYDIAQKVVYRKNISDEILSDTKFCKMTIAELLGNTLSNETLEQLFNILNSNPEKVIAKNEVDTEWWKEERVCYLSDLSSFIYGLKR